MILAVGLVGATFYGVMNRHYLGTILGRTLGPYTDTLAEHIFNNSDPETLRQIAERHDVSILLQPASGDPVGFSSHGDPITAADIAGVAGQVRADRTAPDGARLTLLWSLRSSPASHITRMLGLALILGLVLASAFWFLQRQLKPLASLRAGVNAVSRGDFTTRVPVVRNDEIGQVAGAFNEMAGRVGAMIDDRERLLADVSHELRSPIARMKVALELVPEGDKRESLSRDLKEMEILISVLLEREGLRSRAGRLETEEIDLGELAREIVSIYAQRGPGVELISGGSTILLADRALMRVLLQNLIDNAVKFSRPESRPVSVRLENAGEIVVVRVADDGIGIPEGGGAGLFEPFVKLDRARGHRSGYGIGLNLCQRIVQLHGGTIRLQPRDTGGVEAVVELLRQSPDNPGTEA